MVLKKKNKKILLFAVILVVVLLVISVFLYNKVATNTKKVNEEKSMIEKQEEVEKTIVTKGYTLDNPNVILNPYGNSPLTALIIFDTKEAVSPVVTINGKDELTTFTQDFEKSVNHVLPIYGLYADYDNVITIKCGNEVKQVTIKTDELPSDFILPEKVYKEEDKLTNDLYFYTPSSKGYTCAYDVNGDVRWYLTNYALWKIDRLANGHLMVSTERLVNSPYYMTGLYEMDLLGKIYNEYGLEGGYHHDYYEMENGNLLIASDKFNNEDGTVEDYVVELDRKTGKVVKEFDLRKVLKMDDGQSENWTSYDWFHNNSVWYDKNTNSITLSGRHKDAVINIDYDTGKLNWIIGDPTNWDEEYQKYFFTPVGDNFEWQWSQHAAMITPEGYVFILDNGNNKSKIKDEYVPAENSYTRGVMYKIDTENMTIEQVWEYGKERGSEFYSPYISDVDYLSSGHYIVHSGGIVYVDGKNSNYPAGISGYDRLVSDTVELIDDEVVFELVLPTNNYRVEKMSLYASNKNFTFTKANKIGSLGQTKVDDEKFGPIINYSEIDDDYKSHEISVTAQDDRLVVSGRFKKEDDVEIILYKNLKQKVYDLPVSKKPYTALCVDLFTEEETENGIVVTKYVNYEGLSGNYSVYIKINDKVYNTGRYVKI